MSAVVCGIGDDLLIARKVQSRDLVFRFEWKGEIPIEFAFFGLFQLYQPPLGFV